MDRASFETETLSVDGLIAGNAHLLVALPVTLAAGTAYARGTVLGKIATGATTAEAASAFVGAGDGTLTLDAETPVLAGAKAGAYKVVCITEVAEGGTFRVSDPDGYVLGDVAVGATFANHIKFVIADGATDFDAGDTFTITVTIDTAAGSGEYTTSIAAATDGSQVPDLILAETVDATLAAKTALAYARGDFAAAALTLGAGHTVASITEGLRAKGITLL